MSQRKIYHREILLNRKNSVTLSSFEMKEKKNQQTFIQQVVPTLMSFNNNLFLTETMHNLSSFITVPIITVT